MICKDSAGAVGSLQPTCSHILVTSYWKLNRGPLTLLSRLPHHLGEAKRHIRTKTATHYLPLLVCCILRCMWSSTVNDRAVSFGQTLTSELQVLMRCQYCPPSVSRYRRFRYLFCFCCDLLRARSSREIRTVHQHSLSNLCTRIITRSNLGRRYQ